MFMWPLTQRTRNSGSWTRDKTDLALAWSCSCWPGPLPGTAPVPCTCQNIPGGMQERLQLPNTSSSKPRVASYRWLFCFVLFSVWAHRREDPRGAGVVPGDGLVLDLPGRQVRAAPSGLWGRSRTLPPFPLLSGGDTLPPREAGASAGWIPGDWGAAGGGGTRPERACGRWRLGSAGFLVNAEGFSECFSTVPALGESGRSASRARETSPDARLQARPRNPSHQPINRINTVEPTGNPAGSVVYFWILTPSLPAFISPCKKTRRRVLSGRWRRKRRSSSGSECRDQD